MTRTDPVFYSTCWTFSVSPRYEETCLNLAGSFSWSAAEPPQGNHISRRPGARGLRWELLSFSHWNPPECSRISCRWLSESLPRIILCLYWVHSYQLCLHYDLRMIIGLIIIRTKNSDFIPDWPWWARILKAVDMIDCFLLEYLEIISWDTSELDSMPGMIHCLSWERGDHWNAGLPRSERRVPTSSGVATSVSYCFRFPPAPEFIWGLTAGAGVGRISPSLK